MKRRNAEKPAAHEAMHKAPRTQAAGPVSPEKEERS